SFGLSRRTAASGEFCDQFAGNISHFVLSSWVGTERQARPSATNNAAAFASLLEDPDVATLSADGIQFVRRLRLDASGVAANTRSLIDFQLGMNPTEFLASWLKKSAAVGKDMSDQYHAIDQMFGSRHEGA